MFARALAAATQLIKGGGAAQGAPGPPDGHASTKLFFCIDKPGRTVGAGKRRATMEEAPQTLGVAVAARIKHFLAGIVLATADAAAPRARCRKAGELQGP